MHTCNSIHVATLGQKSRLRKKVKTCVVYLSCPSLAATGRHRPPRAHTKDTSLCTSSLIKQTTKTNKVKNEREREREKREREKKRGKTITYQAEASAREISWVCVCTLPSASVILMT
jgi:hypothetical protein